MSIDVDDDAISSAKDSRRWEDLVALTDALGDRLDVNAYWRFFRAEALFELGHIQEANAEADFTLRHYGEPEWLFVLKARICIALGGTEEQFLAQAKGAWEADDRDHIKVALIDLAMQGGFFDAALAINQTRPAFRPPADLHRRAVVVQCFNKPDTLSEVLAALNACEGAEGFSLLIFQDSITGSMQAEEYEGAVGKVAQVISEWIDPLSRRFRSVEVVKGKINCGTTATCQIAVDHAFHGNDAVLFLEDDCVLSADALIWAKAIIDRNIQRDDVWFASCETVLFKAKEEAVDPGLVQNAREILQDEGVLDGLILIDNVPSSCFITSSTVWARCGRFRGMPRGDENLAQYVRHIGARTIVPVVPRAADIGTLNKNGYSMQIFGRSGFRSAKNTYLISERTDVTNMAFYEGPRERLISTSTVWEVSLWS